MVRFCQSLCLPILHWVSTMALLSGRSIFCSIRLTSAAFLWLQCGPCLCCVCWLVWLRLWLHSQCTHHSVLLWASVLYLDLLRNMFHTQSKPLRSLLNIKNTMKER